MKIKIRWLTANLYAEVAVIENGTTIDLGMLSKDERRSLCNDLYSAIEDIAQRDNFTIAELSS